MPLFSFVETVVERLELHVGGIMATKKKTKKTAAKKTTKKATKATAKKKTTRKPNAAFMSPMKPSAALAEIIGEKAIPRTEVVKKLWAYIKKQNLQDPKNKRNIVADEALTKVFKGKKVVTMFEMTKLVNAQLTAV